MAGCSRDSEFDRYPRLTEIFLVAGLVHEGLAITPAFLMSNKSSKWMLLSFVSLLSLVMTISPESIYIRQYPQDIFGLLDGIHRTVLGQVAHRDFSAKLRILVYALPDCLSGLDSTRC
jgi:hypothetical protein